ncbi:MAG: DUF58 domain-containing protein [Anaerolineae bacterium]|nr:DUF58 domain-containing protein [Anaerolineae bacterium]
MAESNKTESFDLLLPEQIRRRVDPLMLVAKNIRSGSMKGERRSVKRGTSVEFADYRNYVPGDDLRKLDWNVYARLEKPYIKLLEDEEDLAVHLLLDASASMNWPNSEETEAGGNPEHNKLLFAQRIFATLAYISLSTGDRLMMTAMNDRGTNYFGPSRGRAQTVGMLRYAHRIEAQGVTDLNHTLRQYAIREKRAGLVFIISDMFSPTGYVDGLNILLGKGHEVCIIHLLSPDEIAPPVAGDLRLLDIETGEAQEITVDANMRSMYQQRLTGWLDAIRNDCARKGVHYVMVQTDTPFEKVILFELRKLGIVK